jgi:isocitrate/isopropylmalate dehydrogenase
MKSQDGQVRAYRIGVIRGDGIGPELIDSAVAVLDAAASTEPGLRFDYHNEDGGAETWRRTGYSLAPDALERLRTEVDALLKGPVGLPWVRRSDGTEAGLLGGVLRTGLDTFANLRPIRLLAGIRAAVRREAGEIDYLIVRENTEGLYASRGTGVANRHAASDTLLMTRPGVERVVRFAFATARRRTGAPVGPRVTCVDKSNVLKSHAFFRGIFDEVAAEFPDVEADHLYADAAAQALVVTPDRFDVLVMENFLGDLLSDLGAGTVGGLGMCPSANVGERHAYFEPVHGSAPDIAGRNLGNPTSQILSAALMLDHLGEPEVAGRVRAAVARAYADGLVRLDPAGRPACGTTGVTQAVIAGLEAAGPAPVNGTTPRGWPTT